MKYFLLIMAIFLVFCLAVSTLPAMGIDSEEMNCMSLNIYHEARGEPEHGQLLVAHVVMNRVDAAQWPDTVCGVVYQDKQFSWTHDNISDDTPNHRARQKSREIARQAMSGRGKRKVDGPTHYHASNIVPWWASKLEFMYGVGNHKFYR